MPNERFFTAEFLLYTRISLITLSDGGVRGTQCSWKAERAKKVKWSPY